MKSTGKFSQEVALASTFQGAKAQVPTTTAKSWPRKMEIQVGKSVVKSLAAEILFDVMLVVIFPRAHAAEQMNLVAEEQLGISHTAEFAW